MLIGPQRTDQRGKVEANPPVVATPLPAQGGAPSQAEKSLLRDMPQLKEAVYRLENEAPALEKARADRVAALKQALTAGTLPFDARAVAKSILTFHRSHGR